MNRFQRIVYARLKALQLEAGAAAATDHHPTTGTVREGYLRRFLKDMTPWGVSLTGGVMIDLRDDVSPQIDLIATLDSAVPRLIFEESISIVPVEAALLTIEVKSTLDSNHLSQLCTHNSWIKDAPLCFPPSETRQTIPTAILAYDSALSSDTVKSWMESNAESSNTMFCCVIDKFYLSRKSDSVKPVPRDGNFYETMEFVSDYRLALEANSNWRAELAEIRRSLPASEPYPHPLEAYLKNLRTLLNLPGRAQLKTKGTSF